MKILILSSEFPPGPGGIGTHAFQLASQFVFQGGQVVVLSPQDYASNEEILAFNQKQPFEVIYLQHLPTSILEGAGRFLELRKVVRRIKPDIIVASGQRAVWLAAALSKMNDTLWIAVGHGTEFGYEHQLERRLTNWSFNQADGVVSVSQYTFQQMQKIGIAPRKSAIIPNGADDTIFKPIQESDVNQFRENYNFKQCRLILSVGNVSIRKGHDTVIRSLPRVLQVFPNVEYAVMGLPSMASEWMDLSSSLGVSKHVHFLGRVCTDTLVAAYNASEVFLMTSRHAGGDFEGFGIAAIEAALCGKPAIVTKGSGLEEAVVDHFTGLYVTEDSHEEVEKAIISLLENPATAKLYGGNAQQRAMADFTWKKIAGRYLTFIEQIVQGELAS